MRTVPDVTLGQIRARIDPARYQRSTGRALGALAVDITLYVAALTVTVLAPPLLAPALGIVVGITVASLFVWGHDAAHGALFRSAGWSEVLGTVAMLPSLHAYRLWDLGHNKVHHGFTSLSTVDWIWRPMSPDEYCHASRWRRFVYRLERHPATCGLHYLLRVWWPGMVTFRPPRKRNYRVSQAVVVLYAVVLSVVAYWVSGSWLGVVGAVVVPFLVFTYVIALVVYLHHTNPETVFFDDRKAWSPATVQLACSTVVRTPRLVEALTHNILIHMPHHVDSRIPYYHLTGAYEDLRAAFGDTIIEYRFRPATVRSVFRHCQLFDPATQRWSRFEELAGQ